MDWRLLAYFARKNRLDFSGSVPQCGRRSGTGPFEGPATVKPPVLAVDIYRMPFHLKQHFYNETLGVVAAGIMLHHFPELSCTTCAA
jgi:hypothetical protein